MKKLGWAIHVVLVEPFFWLFAALGFLYMECRLAVKVGFMTGQLKWCDFIQRHK